MAYLSQRDRQITPAEFTETPWPLAPSLLTLTSGYQPGVFDLRWDDPSTLAQNAKFRLLGVNVYRSFDSEYGPYDRITDLTVGATFWRDQTDNELVLEEDVSKSFVFRGDTSSPRSPGRWVFRTLWPIVVPGSQRVFSNSPDDVRVCIDGTFVRPKSVSGFSGEVEIDPVVYADVTRQTWDPSLVPGPNSRVTCSYRRNRSLVRTDLGQRVFYRVTSVGVLASKDFVGIGPGDLLETPLEYAGYANSYEIEKLDQFWREAVRRNRFILEQGGERVKVFLRKHVGVLCTCFQDDYHKQPLNDCATCYGSGYVGGYEGPYDALVAPDDGEKRISQKDTGRSFEHSYEVWTGPVPLLSQRDFLVKQNGDRYSIGAIRFPSNRGMILQQHFSIAHLDEKDVRYRVPMDRYRFPAVEFGPSGPEREAGPHPLDQALRAEVTTDLSDRDPVWRR